MAAPTIQDENDIASDQTRAGQHAALGGGRPRTIIPNHTSVKGVILVYGVAADNKQENTDEARDLYRNSLFNIRLGNSPAVYNNVILHFGTHHLSVKFHRDEAKKLLYFDLKENNQVVGSIADRDIVWVELGSSARQELAGVISYYLTFFSENKEDADQEAKKAKAAQKEAQDMENLKQGTLKGVGPAFIVEAAGQAISGIAGAVTAGISGTKIGDNKKPSGTGGKKTNVPSIKESSTVQTEPRTTSQPQAIADEEADKESQEPAEEVAEISLTQLEQKQAAIVISDYLSNPTAFGDAAVKQQIISALQTGQISELMTPRAQMVLGQLASPAALLAAGAEAGTLLSAAAIINGQIRQRALEIIAGHINEGGLISDQTAKQQLIFALLSGDFKNLDAGTRAALNSLAAQISGQTGQDALELKSALLVLAGGRGILSAEVEVKLNAATGAPAASGVDVELAGRLSAFLPAEIATIPALAVNLAVQAFGQIDAAAQADLKGTRIYDNPEQDPAVKAAQPAINLAIDGYLNQSGLNDEQKQQLKLYLQAEVTAPVWQSFALAYPQKAQEYAATIPWLKLAELRIAGQIRETGESTSAVPAGIETESELTAKQQTKIQGQASSNSEAETNIELRVKGKASQQAQAMSGGIQTEAGLAVTQEVKISEQPKSPPPEIKIGVNGKLQAERQATIVAGGQKASLPSEKMPPVQSMAGAPKGSVDGIKLELAPEARISVEKPLVSPSGPEPKSAVVSAQVLTKALARPSGLEAMERNRAVALEPKLGEVERVGTKGQLGPAAPTLSVIRPESELEGEREQPAGESAPAETASEQPSGREGSGQTAEQQNPAARQATGAGRQDAPQNQEQESDQTEPESESEEEGLPPPIAGSSAATSQAEKSKNIAEAVRLVNPAMNQSLITASIWVWGLALETFGLSVILGALAGDFIWAFKKTLIKSALNKVWLSKTIVGKEVKPDDIADQVKFSVIVKANIIAMNAVVVAMGFAAVLFFGVVLYAGCTYPLGQTISSGTNYKLSIIGGMGYSSVCQNFMASPQGANGMLTGQVSGLPPTPATPPAPSLVPPASTPSGAASPPH